MITTSRIEAASLSFLRVTSLVILVTGLLTSALVRADATATLMSGEPDFSPASLQTRYQVPRQCAREAQQIEDDASSYYNETHLFKGSTWSDVGNRRAAAVWRRDQEILKRVEDHKPGCFASLSILYVMARWQLDIPFEEGLKTERDPSLIEFLFRSGHLKPLSKKDRRRLGGIWAETVPGSAGRPKVFGAYDCETSTIYFDPYLAPFDAFSVVAHEIDHLFRDKFVTPDDMHLSFREFVLADEFLASLHAGFLQAGDSDIVRSSFDNTLSNPKGHLRQLLNHYGGHYLDQRSPGSHFSTFLKDVLFAPREQAHFESLVQLVSRAYFANSVDAADSLLRALPRLGSDQLEPAPEIFLGRSPITLSGLERLMVEMEKPSRSCQMLRNQNPADLADYFGSKVPSPANLASPSGNVKPGNEGVKPGNEGVKPGNEGVKPSRTLRPCLQPANEF